MESPERSVKSVYRVQQRHKNKTNDKTNDQNKTNDCYSVFIVNFELI